MKYTVTEGLLGYIVQYRMPNDSRLFTIASNNGLSAGQAEAIAWALNSLHDGEQLYTLFAHPHHSLNVGDTLMAAYNGSTEGI